MSRAGAGRSGHRRFAIAAVLGTLAALLGPELAAQAAAPRFALVIGNAAYTNLPALRNPVNDAKAVGKVLAALGFSVTFVQDGNRRQINQSIMGFREALAADRQSEGFFYYAGHGVQAKGTNYLIPVAAEIRSEADLEDEAVSLQRLMASLEEARNRVNIVVLDACRDNPLPPASRSLARGLAAVSAAPPECVVLFSTAQNQTAADGMGDNSPFALALVKYLPEPGDITTTIKRVTAEVKRLTSSTQTPFQYTSLDIDYSLNRGTVALQPQLSPSLTLTRDYGSVVVSAASAGSLWLDGKPLGDLPAGSEARLDNIEAGERSIELRYAGGERETKSAAVAKGGSVRLRFEWKPGPAKTAAAPVAASPPAPAVPAARVASQKARLTFEFLDGDALTIRYEDGSYWKYGSGILEGDSIPAGGVIVTGPGSAAEFELVPAGTKIVLGPSSSLRLVAFPDEGSARPCRFELLEGRVRFVVAPSPLPLILDSPRASLQCRSGDFRLSAAPKGPVDADAAYVTQGSARFTRLARPGIVSAELILYPGSTATTAGPQMTARTMVAGELERELPGLEFQKLSIDTMIKR